mgnify:CR=1 FL=1
MSPHGIGSNLNILPTASGLWNTSEKNKLKGTEVSHDNLSGTGDKGGIVWPPPR